MVARDLATLKRVLERPAPAERRAQAVGRHAAERDRVGADERRQRAQRRRRRRRARRRDRAAPHAAGGGAAPAANHGSKCTWRTSSRRSSRWVFGVDAADELAVVEDRQRVVAVHALVARRVDLDPVVEAEQARDALAVPEERVERRRAASCRVPARGAAAARASAGEVARPARTSGRGVALDRDLHDLARARAARAARARRPPGANAREREVQAQVLLGRRAHRVQRALEVPAPELLRPSGSHGERSGSTRSSRSKRFWKCWREWTRARPVIHR